MVENVAVEIELELLYVPVTKTLPLTSVATLLPLTIGVGTIGGAGAILLTQMTFPETELYLTRKELILVEST
jgi:hypothetical protein